MNLANTALWVVALVSCISNSTDDHCERSRQIVIRLNVLKTVQQVKYIPPTRTHMHLLHTQVCSRVGKLKAWNKDYRMYVLDMRKSQLGKKSNENSTNYNNVALDFTSRLSEDFVLKKIFEQYCSCANVSMVLFRMSVLGTSKSDKVIEKVCD